MRTTLVASLALLVVGCGTLGHWGSSDDSSNNYGGEGPSLPSSSPSGFGGPPDFGQTRTAKAPPISGGHMLVTPDGNTAVIADPDRDKVWVVDLAGEKVAGAIQLNAGDEPGRVVLDGAGRAHVGLRAAGALVTIDLAAKSVVARRSACGDVRGVAWDSRSDSVHVACATGELVTFPAAGGDATRRIRLEPDLRDVVVQTQGLLVSKFRTAEILTVADDGTIKGRRTPPDSISPYMVPTLAWRMIPPPRGGDGATVVHQRASRVIDNVTSVAAYYSGDDCNGSLRLPQVAAGVTTFAYDQPDTVTIPSAVLPVDVAVNPRGDTYAVIAAGNGHTSGLNSLFTFQAYRVSPGSSDCVDDTRTHSVSGQLTSVAFRNQDQVVAFQREPARLYMADATSPEGVLKAIDFDAPSVEDTGHAIFHSNSGTGIACASCHAEGGDDGLVWTFAKQGRRRTPSLKGTLDGTAPYHWDGDLYDVPALVTRVYVDGMAGPELAGEQENALQSFLFAIPRPAVAPATDTAAVARGKALFEGQAGCTACHSGSKLTNNQNQTVGTGGTFQVPSLVGVAARAPYLHTGCAATLADRFDPTCGGGAQHGKTSDLAASDVADLVAYLSTL